MKTLISVRARLLGARASHTPSLSLGRTAELFAFGSRLIPSKEPECGRFPGGTHSKSAFLSAGGAWRAQGGPYVFVTLLVLVPMVALATVQSADFAGQWERNTKLSQSPSDKIERFFGSGQASGAGGRQYDVFSRTGLLKDVDRVTLRRMLLDYAAVVESLEVELEGQEMTVSVGNDDYFALFYLDGQPHSRQIEEGLLLEATARREGDNVHVEQKGEDGVIREVFSLLNGGKQLAVIFEIEHKALEAPFMFRTVYDRVP